MSCASWEHFWLNEGWTTYIERRIQAAVHGSEAYFGFAAVIGWKVSQNINVSNILAELSHRHYQTASYSSARTMNLPNLSLISRAGILTMLSRPYHMRRDSPFYTTLTSSSAGRNGTSSSLITSPRSRRNLSTATSSRAICLSSSSTMQMQATNFSQWTGRHGFTKQAVSYVGVWRPRY